MPIPDDMSEDAKIAYRAFGDMSNSKQAHFVLLETLEKRYESGGAPSLQENLELEQLLNAHDKNVMAFKAALAALTDENEKLALIKLLS
ncbi:MAG: hypothetical protein AAF353_02785 [Pseudomonadota bacterium]